MANSATPTLCTRVIVYRIIYAASRAVSIGGEIFSLVHTFTPVHDHLPSLLVKILMFVRRGAYVNLSRISPGFLRTITVGATSSSRYVALIPQMATVGKPTDTVAIALQLVVVEKNNLLTGEWEPEFSGKGGARLAKQAAVVFPGVFSDRLQSCISTVFHLVPNGLNPRCQSYDNKLLLTTRFKTTSEGIDSPFPFLNISFNRVPFLLSRSATLPFACASEGPPTFQASHHCRGFFFDRVHSGLQRARFVLIFHVRCCY